MGLSLPKESEYRLCTLKNIFLINEFTLRSFLGLKVSPFKPDVKPEVVYKIYRGKLHYDSHFILVREKYFSVKNKISMH